MPRSLLIGLDELMTSHDMTDTSDNEMDVQAVAHSHDVSRAKVADREAERLVGHVQHVADGFAVAAGDAGGVLMRNLEPLVVGVGDLRRESRCC